MLVWSIYTDIFVWYMHTHELICICGIWGANLLLSYTCQVDIAVACVLAHLTKSVWAVCPFSIMAVWLIFSIWLPCLFIDIKYMYSDTGEEVWYTCIHMGICTLYNMYTGTYIYAYMYTHVCLTSYIPTCIHSHMHACTHTHLQHTCIHMYIHAYRLMDGCFNIYMYTWKHMHTLACLATYIHALMFDWCRQMPMSVCLYTYMHEYYIPIYICHRCKNWDMEFT